MGFRSEWDSGIQSYREVVWHVVNGHILLSILFLLMVVYLECFGYGIKLSLTVSWLGSGNDHRPIARLKVCSGRLEGHSWLTAQSGVAINSTKARGSPYDLSLSLSHTETVKSHAWSLTFKKKPPSASSFFSSCLCGTSKISPLPVEHWMPYGL